MSVTLTAYRPKLAATTPLFSPLRLGQLPLPNRIVMAPLTRARITMTLSPVCRTICRTQK